MAGVDELETGGVDDADEAVEEVFYGVPTGVEIERDDASDDKTRVKPWDPEKIRVSSKSFLLRNILDMIDDDELELAPDFQRNRVWKQRQKSRLIESILLQIPLPAFYFAADSGGTFRVVDGLQRLSTVHQYVNGEFVLDDLEFLQAEGQGFDDLSGPLQRRLRNSQIHVHTIEPSTPNRVKYHIFKRLNTGGEPLNAMEIRHCMSDRRSRDLLKRCAESAAFIRATGGALVNHIRMQDREAALRFLAFRSLTDITTYADSGSIEDLLDATAEAIDQPGTVTDEQLDIWFADFERAMVNAETVFGDRAFRKWARGVERKQPFNRALFESWGVALADYQPEQIEPVRHQIAAATRDAMVDDRRYVDSISSSTASVSRVIKRFEVPRTILRKTVA